MNDIRNYFKSKNGDVKPKPEAESVNKQSQDKDKEKLVDNKTKRNYSKKDDKKVTKKGKDKKVESEEDDEDPLPPNVRKTVEKKLTKLKDIKQKTHESKRKFEDQDDDDEDIIVPRKKTLRRSNKLIIDDEDDETKKPSPKKTPRKNKIIEDDSDNDRDVEQISPTKKNKTPQVEEIKKTTLKKNKFEEEIVERRTSPRKNKSTPKKETEEKIVTPKKNNLKKSVDDNLKLENDNLKKSEDDNLKQSKDETRRLSPRGKKLDEDIYKNKKEPENKKSTEDSTSKRFSLQTFKKPEPSTPKIKIDYQELWVDKHKPKSSSQIIGQQGDKSCVKKLTNWLKNWYKNLDKKPAFGKFGPDDGAGFKAVLLSGPPGIGKTTSAQLVCQELSFDYVEMNASDTRNKKSLQEEVHELLHNKTLAGFVKNSELSNKSLSPLPSSSSSSSSSSLSSSLMTDRHVLIMDEVDGMSGNEDRGGIQELIQLIKKTKVPLICICNDRSHPKIRSLVNYCFDLRFYKPRIEQIKAAMMSIAYKENIQISSDALHELIVSSNQDIRQVLHYLSLISAGHEKSRIDKLINNNSIKDVRLGTFDALRKVFTFDEEYVKMSFQDKSDLFFTDYSIMPLFVYENYLNVNPKGVKPNSAKHLKLVSKTIDAISFGGLIEKEIRTSNNWSLLPTQAAFSSVMPGAYMNGRLGAQIAFPSLLGKISAINRKERLLQELKMHMNLKISGSKNSLNLDYLEPLKNFLINPLIKNGTDGINKVLEILSNYYLKKEDIDTLIELTLWENQPNPMSKIDSKVKAALTRTYNKESMTFPYSFDAKLNKKKNTVDEEYGDNLDNDGQQDDEENDEDNVESDPMIKAKKKTKKSNKKDEKEEKTTKNKKTTTKSKKNK